MICVRIETVRLRLQSSANGVVDGFVRAKACAKLDDGVRSAVSRLTSVSSAYRYQRCLEVG